MNRSFLAIALALGTVVAASPAVALADEYVVTTPVVVERPVIVAQRPWESAHQLHGVVGSFGGFDMTLRVEGEPLPVRLHQGTIINPTGLTIKPGMRVRVFGYWANGRFQANRIVLVY